MSTLLPGLSVLLGAALTLVGLVVGRRIDAREERERWKRDRRVDRYEALGATYYRTREAIRALAVTEVGSAEASRAASRAMNAGADWNNQVIAVWLHGTPTVTAKLRELDRRFDESFLKARTGQYTWEEWRVERGMAEEALEDFIIAVREELELPKLEVRVRGRSVDLQGEKPEPTEGEE